VWYVRCVCMVYVVCVWCVCVCVWCVYVCVSVAALQVRLPVCTSSLHMKQRPCDATDNALLLALVPCSLARVSSSLSQHVFSACSLSVTSETSGLKSFHLFIKCVSVQNWRIWKFSSECTAFLMGPVFSRPTAGESRRSQQTSQSCLLNCGNELLRGLGVATRWAVTSSLCHLK
jgi:hypothetical protein